MTQKRAEWSNKLVFILATAGSAIGLGNIWRFPYLAGENGGGAFVLIYIICLFAIALPIMVAELSIGRASQLSPILAFKKLGGKFGKYWQIIGWFGVLSAFILISYYSVIGGWTIAYIFKSFSFGQIVLEKEAAITSFQQFTANPWEQILWTWAFIGAGVIIVIRGIKGGLEAFNKIFMPGLFVMLLILVLNALMCQGCVQGLKFLFVPDFSEITPSVILAAVGQAFFSLSVGMGAILTYGSYLHQKEDLIKTSAIIATMLLAVALLSGIAIFPVLFTFGLDPEAGPGLTFITLPVAFAKFGTILGPGLGALFFLMLFIAALTSVISIIEPVVSHLVDKGITDRKVGTILVGIGAGILAIPSALSNGANNFFSSNNFFGRAFLEFADFIVADNILPISGCAMALFVLFVMKRSTRHKQVISFYKIWKYLLPIAAIAVVTVYLNKAFESPVWFGIAVAAIVILIAGTFLSRKAHEGEPEDTSEEDNSDE
jgi:NSS family neurotransmitter:Na+ symporter